MKKRGFTLIEVIICVLLLAIIGTVSLMGIKIFNKNKTLDKLEQITDKVLMAAEIYIETNGETYNQLYKEKNGVVIPLNVLVNEGLLDLKGTSLERSDIEEEYVISALATTSSSSTSGCVDITTSTSWNLSSDNPIYICTNNSGGGSSGSGTGNSIYIGSSTSNSESTKGERTLIKETTRNYVSYNSKTFRLLYIDYDDSIVLYTSENTFGDSFKTISQPIQSDEELTTCTSTGFSCGWGSRAPSEKRTICETPSILLFESGSNAYSLTNPLDNTNYNFIIKSGQKACVGLSDPTYSISYRGDTAGKLLMHKRITSTNNEQYITQKIFVDLGSPSFITKKKLYYPTCWNMWNICDYNQISYLTGKIIQLRSCMKIGEGTGTSVNPYKLVNMCN